LQQVVASAAVGAGAINVQVKMIMRGYLMTMPVG
jgi:stage V sporulation protein SpoVS